MSSDHPELSGAGDLTTGPVQTGEHAGPALDLRLAEQVQQAVVACRALPDSAGFEIHYLNPAAERRLGCSQADVVGRPLGERFPDAEAAGLAEVLQQVWRTGEPGRLDSSDAPLSVTNAWRDCRVIRISRGAPADPSALWLIAILAPDPPGGQSALETPEQRSRYRLVFENSLIGIFVVDEQRRIIEINDCACDIFRTGAEAMLGQSAECMHVSRESYLRFGEEVFVHIESQGVADVRYLLRRADGETFQAALSGRPLNGVDRKAGVIWSIADISAADRAERALRASEERFSLAVAGSNEGIWDWDITSQRVYFSPRWKELIGYQDHEIPNRFEEWSRRVHPEDFPAASAAIEAHLRGETEFLETEFRMRCKDGSWRWILGRGLCVRDEQGWPLRMAGSHSDIDARRRAEDRARAKEIHLAAVISTVQTGIAVIDHDRRLVVDANERAAEMLGMPRDTLIGSPCGGRLCQDPSNCPFVSAAPEAWSAVTDEETVFIRGDGSRLTVLRSSVPLRLNDRNLLIESFADITPIKRNEIELRRAKEAAESAALAKSEFLAKMSHEIRTPMNSILGMTKLTLDTELDAEQRENLEIVDASAEALLALIDDILDFSKLEAHRVGLAPVDFDLTVLFDELLDGFGFRADEKGLELIEFIDPQVPLGLRGDAQRLRQVLVNLLGNAIKFTAVGEVILSVELADALGAKDAGASEQAADPGVFGGSEPLNWLQFTVRDTGVGVPADKHAEIFSAFQQADNTVTREFGGSGLGLSISQQLVELMGGRIGVFSEPGRGSEFWFRLPLGAARNQAIAPPLPHADLKQLRCLVVDDNAANRLLLEKTLAGWGTRSVAAGSGREAVTLLREAKTLGDPFGLVLLDLAMPEMDGEQTARTIHGDPDCGQPTIILLASVALRGNLSRLRDIGVRKMLIKPIKRRLLLDAILEVLGDPESLPVKPTEPIRTVGRHPRFTGARVLLVEDRPFNQKVAVSYLSRYGVDVITARDGAQALVHVRAQPFDLILMDVQMPVMDGYRAAAAIRAETGHPNPDTPIVAMTAHALEGDRERCLAAGMNDYLTKPVRVERLEAALSRYLTKPAPVDLGPEDLGSRASANPRCVAAQLPPELESLFEGDPEGLDDLLQSFVQDAAKDLSALLNAWGCQDLAGVREHAHGLRGLVANLGFDKLGALLGRLEASVAAVAGDRRNGDLRRRAALIDQLQIELSGVFADLKARSRCRSGGTRAD